MGEAAAGGGRAVVLVDRAGDGSTRLCGRTRRRRHSPVVDLPSPTRCNDAAGESSTAPGGSTSSTPTPAPTSAETSRGGDPDAWDRMLNLNVNAAFRSVHAVLPHMVGAEGGRHRRHQFGRRRRAGRVGAGLHRLQARRAGLRPHDCAGRSMKHGVRVGAVAARPGGHRAARRLAEGQAGRRDRRRAA